MRNFLSNINFYSIVVLVLLSGKSYSQDPVYSWAGSMGGNASDEGRAIAADASGNIFITGYFNNTSDFDPDIADEYNLVSAGGDDIFLAKYDVNGNILWAVNMGGSSTDQAFAVAVDGDNHVIISGYFSGEADFDPSSSIANLQSSESTAIFFAKYDTDGNHIWSRALDIPYTALNKYSGIAIGENNSIILSGSFEGTKDFDPSDATENMTSAGNCDIYIAEFDADGNYIQSERIGGAGNDQATSIAIDSENNILIAGTFSGTVDFNPSTGSSYDLTESGVDNSFLAKYNQDISLIWAKNFNGGQELTISIDSEDHIVLLGSQLTLSTDLPFLHKYNSEGTHIWTIEVLADGKGITVDAVGNIYVTGRFFNSTDFDPSLSSANFSAPGGEFDIFLASYDESGNYRWAFNVGSVHGFESGTGICKVDDKIIVTGAFVESADFDPSSSVTNLSSSGTTDTEIFLAAYIVCVNSSKTINPVACNSYTAPDGFAYTSSGMYTAIIPNASGCDSVITIDLTINSADNTISQDGNNLSANASGAVYQWLNCDNGNTEINGETNQVFSPAASGNYALKITQNGCVDTSDCINVVVLDLFSGIQEKNLYLWPNPSKGFININAEFANADEIYVLNAIGEIMLQTTPDIQSKGLDLSSLENGFYFLKFCWKEKERVFPVIIEK